MKLKKSGESLSINRNDAKWVEQSKYQMMLNEWNIGSNLIGGKILRSIWSLTIKSHL